MKIPTTRSAALPVAMLAAAGFLLAACSGGDTEVQRTAPRPIPPVPHSQISDQNLGTALDKLVFQGGRHPSQDGGTCLIDAVKRAKMSKKSLEYIVSTSGDDQATVAEGLCKIDAGDAEVLLSPQLRSSFDACADAVLIPNPTASAQHYEPPRPTGTPAENTADLWPKFPIGNGVSITSAS